MSESNYEQWQRKIAHKRKKQEDKELNETFSALTADHNKRVLIAEWSTEFSNLSDQLYQHPINTKEDL